MSMLNGTSTASRGKGARGLAQFRIANLCLTPFVFVVLTGAAFLLLPSSADAQSAAPSVPAPASGVPKALPADHLIDVLNKAKSNLNASDASAFTGTVKIGGADAAVSTALMIGHTAVENSQKERMKSEVSRHGLILYSPDYTNNNYFPGIVWETGNNNSGKPKIGIWGQMTDNGSKLFLGTSSNNAIGITNQALTIDQSGKVGIGITNPDRALVVTPVTPDGKVARFMGNPWSPGTESTSRIELGDANHYIEAKWGGPFTIDSADNIVVQPTSGNVGIGIINPVEKLEVDGKLKVYEAIVDRTGKTIRDKDGGWVRTYGGTGWYSQTHGGGWYMTDDSWIRSYGNKNIYQNTGILRTDGTLQVGDNGAALNVPASGNFAYRTNVLFANTAGNVGIGTVLPSDKLDVAGSMKVKDRVESRWMVVKDTADAAWPRTYFESKDVKMYTGINQEYGLGQIDVTSNHPLAFYTKDVERIRITLDGNVGIGITNPDRALVVKPSFSSGIVARFAGNPWDGLGNTSRIELGDVYHFIEAKWGGPFTIDSADNIVIQPTNGNVGIGTTDPKGTLDVSGDVVLGKAGKKFIIHPRTASGDFLQITNQNGNGDWLWGQGITLRDNGNVGIGTSDPLTELHIESRDQNAQIFLDVQPGNNKRSAIAFAGTFRDSAANPSVKIPAAIQAGFLGNTWDQAFLGFHVGGTDENCTPTGNNFPCTRMIIRNNGNVGIGTTNPQYKLDVNGTINATEIYKNGSPLLTSQWTTSGNNIYYNTGYVGIGTESPNRALVVKPSSTSGNVARFIGNPWSTIGNTSRIELGDANHYLEAKWGGPFTIDSGDNIAIQPTNGNVGIGTISPQSRLTILGSGVTPGTGEAARKGLIQIQNNTSAIGQGGLEFKSADSGYGYGWIISAPDMRSENVPLVFAARRNNANWREYMRITNQGDVGIGTTAPADRLEIAGGGSIRLTSGGWNSGAIRFGSSIPGTSSDYNPTYPINDYFIQRGATDSYKNVLVVHIPDRTSSKFSVMASGAKEYLTVKGRDGNVGIGVQWPQFKLDVGGPVNVAFTQQNKKIAMEDSSFGMDIAELFDATGDVEEGDVLVVSPQGKTVTQSSQRYQKGLLGVVSASPAIVFEGSEIKLAGDPARFIKGKKPPVTLAGRVLVKVSTENGTIQPGDYLTSSSVPGVAMKATEPGPTIGIALESFIDKAPGWALVFVNIGENNLTTLINEQEKMKKRLEHLELQIKEGQ